MYTVCYDHGYYCSACHLCGGLIDTCFGRMQLRYLILFRSTHCVWRQIMTYHRQTLRSREIMAYCRQTLRCQIITYRGQTLRLTSNHDVLRPDIALDVKLWRITGRHCLWCQIMAYCRQTLSLASNYEVLLAGTMFDIELWRIACTHCVWHRIMTYRMQKFRLMSEWRIAGTHSVWRQIVTYHNCLLRR